MKLELTEEQIEQILDVLIAASVTHDLAAELDRRKELHICAARSEKKRDAVDAAWHILFNARSKAEKAEA